MIGRAAGKQFGGPFSPAWKGFDWNAMNRLYEQGYISEPRGRAKSVVFTENGLERSKQLLEELFSQRDR